MVRMQICGKQGSSCTLPSFWRAAGTKDGMLAAAQQCETLLQRQALSIHAYVKGVDNWHSCRSVGSEEAAAQSRSAEELQALRLAYQEQQSILATSQQHEGMLQQQAQSLQQELEQLRAESRKSGQYSDLQRQFQEASTLLESSRLGIVYTHACCKTLCCEKQIFSELRASLSSFILRQWRIYRKPAMPCTSLRAMLV